MRILTSTTSPYARIARVALAEKGFDLGDTRIVNPWADDDEMLRLNPASRVPTLELDSGLPLTESLLILLWLERRVPEPTLLAGDLDRVVSRAGLAMGVIDAMTNIVTGVMQIDPGFAESRVDLKRRRTIVTGFRGAGGRPAGLRRGHAGHGGHHGRRGRRLPTAALQGHAWAVPIPRLESLRAAVAGRPSFSSTEPYVQG